MLDCVEDGPEPAAPYLGVSAAGPVNAANLLGGAAASSAACKGTTFAADSSQQ